MHLSQFLDRIALIVFLRSLSRFARASRPGPLVRVRMSLSGRVLKLDGPLVHAQVCSRPSPAPPPCFCTPPDPQFLATSSRPCCRGTRWFPCLKSERSCTGQLTCCLVASSLGAWLTQPVSVETDDFYFLHMQDNNDKKSLACICARGRGCYRAVNQPQAQTRSTYERSLGAGGQPTNHAVSDRRRVLDCKKEVIKSNFIAWGYWPGIKQTFGSLDCFNPA
jgi:hypothetical protein